MPSGFRKYKGKKEQDKQKLGIESYIGINRWAHAQNLGVV